VGTSTSFRAPGTPRWQAFAVALQEGLASARVESELFNAGAEWEEALAAPAVTAFALAVTEASETLGDSLRSSDRVEDGLRRYVAQAREKSLSAGASPALALAERALAAVLTRAGGGSARWDSLGAEGAEAAIRGALATPRSAISAYLGELLSQYAQHVVAREAGRLTEGERAVGIAEVRRRTRELSLLAQELGQSVPAEVDIRDVSAAWPALVREAFRRGRALPQGSG
jgi:hypothetical protein